MKFISAIMALILMQAVLLAPVEAWAQKNSPQAIKAVRKHRAEQARLRQTEPPQPRPYSSGANPNVNPNISLKSCLDHVGINPVARDSCMRQHCQGRWGRGDCPAGADFMATTGASAKTPLGRCLRAAAGNPFKRDACGWQHCGGRSDKSAECAAFYPKRANAQYGN
ncbi:MAG: hypothetical protein LBE78_09585 [Burkholderiaceae bacterium]|nr:hypothetical protein [Burkholderiaceae bacterium]